MHILEEEADDWRVKSPVVTSESSELIFVRSNVLQTHYSSLLVMNLNDYPIGVMVFT
jgi:hypothetical protein